VYKPGTGKARRTLEYFYNHGSRMGGSLRSRLGGVNDVYGVEQLRVLADNDEADQIAMSMYGNLANAHTPGTFIAGEAANAGPLGLRWPLQFDGESWTERDAFRGMYNSPNTANNTMFLRALRMTLVHELGDDAHVPRELRLGFATPRTWLADGEHIAVRDAPTSFGPVSYRVESHVAQDRIAATVTLPARQVPERTTLRVRAPHPKRMIALTIDGEPSGRFNPQREEIDLTGLSGTVELEISYSDGQR
jgi:hypothetical protein